MSVSARRIIVQTPGAPDAMTIETFTLSAPQPGEALVRHTAIGVNYIDTYHRSGLYPLPLPATLGSEAAGVVEAIGSDVRGLEVGQRVAYAAGKPGSYATHRTIDAKLLIPLPDDIDDTLAASAMLKGLTAWMLVEACAKVESGQAVLVHAAAGGVGSILVQWLHAIGAIVIAHAGSAEKAERAKALGADQAISTPLDQLANAVRSLTDGKGVAVVLDGVGKTSWAASLDSLAIRGLLVSYGNASGAVPPFAPLELASRGSLFVTRPIMSHYIEAERDRSTAVARLFEMLRTGKIKVETAQRFPLEQAAEAHRALEARTTYGSTILMP